MGKRVSNCLRHKRPWVKECPCSQVRLHVASTWFELPFCPLIYVLVHFHAMKYKIGQQMVARANHAAFSFSYGCDVASTPNDIAVPELRTARCQSPREMAECCFLTSDKQTTHCGSLTWLVRERAEYIYDHILENTILRGEQHIYYHRTAICRISAVDHWARD